MAFLYASRTSLDVFFMRVGFYHSAVFSPSSPDRDTIATLCVFGEIVKSIRYAPGMKLSIAKCFLKFFI